MSVHRLLLVDLMNWFLFFKRVDKSIWPPYMDSSAFEVNVRRFKGF